MAKPSPGTRPWFEAARLDLLESTRATQSLYMAADAANRLASRWDALDQTLAFALTTACIVNYCRPFVDRHTDRGVRRYKLKRVARQAGFDVALHRHFLQLRHKMVAHSDEDFLDAKIHAQTALISNGERQIKLIAELGARSTAFWLLRERAVAQKWCVHATSAMTAAARDTSAGLETYFEAARAYPDACPLLDVDGAERLAAFKATLQAGETFSVPLSEMPLSHLKPPPLALEHGDYLFQLFSLNTRGRGTTVTDLGDGWSITDRREPDEPLPSKSE